MGRLYSWGDCSHGALGHSSLEDLSEPRLIECVVGKYCVDVSCGEHFTVAVFSKTQKWSTYLAEFEDATVKEATE